jgi:putative DNA primase/helicase
MNNITNSTDRLEAPGQTGKMGAPYPDPAWFAASADGFVRQGWSIFPQRRDARRAPGLAAGGRMIRWQADHDLQNKLPTPAALEEWKMYCGTLNVAAVMGPASGDAWCLDIDCTDQDTVWKLQDLADEVLGVTGFRREGNPPKLALLYRGTSIASRSLRFADLTLGAVEILGPGKPITLHGRHWKTDRVFSWLGEHMPLLDGPECAPLVKPEQVEEFLARVAAEIAPFAAAASRTGGTPVEWAEGTAGISVPRLSSDARWTEDEAGTVIDGREAFLAALVYHAGRAAAAGGIADRSAFVQSLAAAVAAEFRSRAAMTGRWSEGALRREATAKSAHLADRILAGVLRPKERVAMPETEAPAQNDDWEQALEAWSAPPRQPEPSRPEPQGAAQPEPEAAKDIAADANDEAGFLPLGYDRDERGGMQLFFMGRGSKVWTFTPGSLRGTGGLMQLAPMTYWRANYPGKKGGVDLDAAADALVAAALVEGVYDPLSKIRGRGAWLDAKGEVVLHLGDRVVRGGRVMAPAEVRDGRFIYEETLPLDIALGEPLTAAEGAGLIRLCSALPLRDAGQGKLLAGWLAVAPICGVLPWRPHLWLTGERGHGKSWAMDNVVTPALMGLILPFASKTSEAAIRISLGQDARPSSIDEFETQNARDRERVQQVLDFLRHASSPSSAAIVKGTKDQGTRRYLARTCAIVSSVNLSLAQAADKSRFLICEFVAGSGPDRERERQFEALRTLQADVISEDLGGRLLARSLKLAKAVRASAEVFASVISVTYGSRRLGDTIGVPLAGLWSLEHDAPVTRGEAEEFVLSSGFVADAAEQASSDPEWRQAATFLSQQTVRVLDDEGHGLDLPIGEIVAGWAALGDTEMPTEAARRALKRAGLQVRGRRLEVANSSKFLAHVFRESIWGASWAPTLRRMPGAERLATAVTWTPGLTSKGMSLPVEVFLDA